MQTFRKTQINTYLLLTLACMLIPPISRAQDVVALPSAKAGVPYEYTFRSEGGLPPLQWRVVSGALPEGLELGSTGTLKGTATTARQQAFEFSVEVKDAEQPAQTYVHRFKIAVAPSQLRIVTTVPALRILKPKPSPSTAPESSTIPSSPAPEVTPASFTDVREPRWLVPLRTVTPQEAAAESPAKTDGQDKLLVTDQDSKICNPPSKPQKRADKSPLDPALFIQIVEDTTGGNHLCRYKQDSSPQFGVDLDSSLRIIPDKSSMGPEPALNKLYVSAKLTSGDSSKDVVVSGYSEVGKDKSTMASQSGTAFQTAANVQAMIFNMAYTVGDIIRYVYLAPSDEKVTDETTSAPAAKDTANNPTRGFQAWLETHKEVDFLGPRARSIDKAISSQSRAADPFATGESGENSLLRIQERFHLYQPEIKALSDFFLQPENLAIVERVGVDVFWIDRNSLKAIAQQYKDDIQVAFDENSTAKAKASALKDLLERTKLVYKDFGDFRTTVETSMAENFASEQHTNEEWNAIFEENILQLSNRKRIAAFKQLKNRLATGSISLADYQAKDGDRLTITVESMPADGTSGGVPAVFYISIKKYGAKIQWSPSLLFVRRLGVTDAEASPPASSSAAPVNRVNFAPSPGMTFGVAFFKRGDGGGDKFLRALGPGVGMNVTFMNYNDPSFDLATGKFVNTTGTNVQVGAGVIGSLFDNKLQLTYGWNLNVEQRRRYFGVGFGFIEMGKELTKYIGK